MTADVPNLGEAVRWAIEDSSDPARVAADWVAREIDPSCASAVALVTNPRTRLERLVAAKEAFKAMRITGETAADRREGARLYAAAIAAALVHHGERSSSQSNAALDRAFGALSADVDADAAIRDLARRAAECLDR